VLDVGRQPIQLRLPVAPVTAPLLRLGIREEGELLILILWLGVSLGDAAALVCSVEWPMQTSRQ
jgi:hypothetical protein